MSFRPDSPLNRLILLWPGVPIAACALGFILSLFEVSQSHDRAFAALAIAMGCGLACSVGLLFHCFFIEWVEVTVSRDGIALRPVGMSWLNRQPRLVPWQQVKGLNEVTTRDGGRLEISVESEVVRLDRALFREDTFSNLRTLLAQRTAGLDQGGYARDLATAA
ncbi:MAG: hypothetical protein M3077_06820 [Candidatus Dormibacteraeota bacterium]|nr:hypothetical protein [Candidatus Dormibacteraeota bacterium]